MFPVLVMGHARDDQTLQPLQVEWLETVIKSSQFEGELRDLRVIHPGHHDDLGMPLAGHDLFEYFNSSDVWRLDIEKHNVDIGMFFERLQRLLPIFRGNDRVAAPGEKRFEHLQQLKFIIIVLHLW